MIYCHHLIYWKVTACLVIFNLIHEKRLRKLIPVANTWRIINTRIMPVHGHVVTKKVFQKQPSRGVLRKRYSENKQQILQENTHCRIMILIKLLCTFIEITLWHGCSPVNLVYICRTPSPKNTSGWLLLVFWNILENMPDYGFSSTRIFPSNIGK